MKKLVSLLKDLSNSIFVFLFLISLVYINNLFPAILNHSYNTIQLCSITSQAAFEQKLDHVEIRDINLVQETLNEIDGINKENRSHELQLLIDSFESSIKDYNIYIEDEYTDYKFTAATKVYHRLQNLIDYYTKMVDNRLKAYEILLNFLYMGITIQFIILIFSIVKNNRTREDMKESKRDLITFHKIRENERRKIASFLHDSVMQNLGSLIMTPEVQKSDKIRTTLEQTTKEIRNLANSTAPLQLYSLGLENSIRDLVITFRKTTGLKTSFDVLGISEINLDNDVLLVLYRVVQESLNNIRKHANASNIIVRIIESHPYLILTIQDDGKGMDVNEERQLRKNHFGLLLMEQQVLGIGGEFSIRSVQNEGTHIRIRYKLTNGE